MNCHHRTASVSCQPCHEHQRNLIEAAGVFHTFEPDPMFEAGMTCRDCHAVEGTHVDRPSEATCGNCHEPGYGSRMQESQKDIQNQMENLEQAMKSSKEISGWAQAYSILNALQQDGTRGAHNPVAAKNALDSIRVTIQK